MRKVLLLAVLPGLLSAAGLEIVRPIIAQSDGGTPVPASFEHAAGETLFFSCRVAGFTKSADQKIDVSYSVQAFDPKGVALTELYQNEIVTEVAPQDKEWLPKIQTEVQIPPLVASGTYKLVVKAEDVLAKTTAELAVPVQVRGRQLEPSATLVVRNFRFYRGGGYPARGPGRVPGRRRGVGQVRYHRIPLRREEPHRRELRRVRDLTRRQGVVDAAGAGGGTERIVLPETVRGGIVLDQSAGQDHARGILDRGDREGRGGRADIRDQANVQGGVIHKHWQVRCRKKGYEESRRRRNPNVRYHFGWREGDGSGFSRPVWRHSGTVGRRGGRLGERRRTGRRGAKLRGRSDWRCGRCTRRGRG